MRPDRLAGNLGVGGLDAEEDEIGAGDGGRIVCRGEFNPVQPVGALDDEPLAPDRLDMHRPRDQRHLMSGPRQHAAEIAADRPGAHDHDAHGDPPDELPR